MQEIQKVMECGIQFLGGLYGAVIRIILRFAGRIKITVKMIQNPPLTVGTNYNSLLQSVLNFGFIGHIFVELQNDHKIAFGSKAHKAT